MAEERQTVRTLLSRSIIKEQPEGNCLVRCLQTFDIFSFIPVPKSRTVSTKCSMIGSFIFFAIFLSYIIYDFVKFLTENPPIPNSYYEDLGNDTYNSPRFAISFMNGFYLEKPLYAPPYFNFTLQQSTKWRGGEDTPYRNLQKCQPDWLGEDIYGFYKELQCPDPAINMTMMGLLYSSNITTNPKIGIVQCKDNDTMACKTTDQIQKMMAQGRFFLFIERTKSKYDQIKGSNFLLYNFFLVPNVYNRINVLMQVNRQIILPDYFTRFKNEESTTLEIMSVSELNSNVAINGPDAALKLLSVQFTLAPVQKSAIQSIKVTEIAYSTFIEHLSMWGALWGVEFAIFAIIFLAYNRKKYYQKNPKWSNYDQQQGKVVNTSNLLK